MRSCFLVLALVTALGTAGCDGGDGGTAPATGALGVGNSTFGPGTDPDGYLVTIDGQAQSPRIPLNGGHVWVLGAGVYSVGISDLAAGCEFDPDNGASTGPNPQNATIAQRDTTWVWFAVQCD
jgi:hypothetical protein